jgi:hypothetical protein
MEPGSEFEIFPYGNQESTARFLSLDLSSQIGKGREGRKYAGIDTRGMGFDFDVGFLMVTDEASALSRHSKWETLHDQGLGEFITSHNLVLKLKGGQEESYAVLTEDLTADGSVVYEDEDFDHPKDIPLKPQLMQEASRWLMTYFNNLNRGSKEDSLKRIQEIGNTKLREAMLWSYRFYIEESNQNELPCLDPVLERDVQRVLEILKTNKWKVGYETFFLLTRRTKDPHWQYARRIIIGDLGINLNRSERPEPFGRWDREQLYSMLSYSYRMGE